MPTSTVYFEATPGNGVDAYWINVDGDDIPLVNGKGQKNIDLGSHLLIWWFIGASGASLAIEGTLANGTKVIEVKGSRIPDGEHEGAGFKRFKLN